MFTEKDVQIMRAVALKAAVEMNSGSEGTSMKRINEVTDMADVFLNWLRK